MLRSGGASCGRPGLFHLVRRSGIEETKRGNFLGGIVQVALARFRNLKRRRRVDGIINKIFESVSVKARKVGPTSGLVPDGRRPRPGRVPLLLGDYVKPYIIVAALGMIATAVPRPLERCFTRP